MADRFLCTEGDTDREVFEALPRATGYKVLPERRQSGAAQPRSGAWMALETALVLAKQGVPVVIAALDMNAGAPDVLYGKAEKAMSKQELRFSGSNGRYHVGETVLSILPVGLSADPYLTELGITSHAIDDFLVLLLQDRPTYDAIVKSNGRQAPDHSQALAVVKGTLSYIRGQNVHFDGSKQVIALFRAIIQFPASLAAFAGSIIKNAPKDLRDSVLKPLNDALA